MVAEIVAKEKLLPQPMVVQNKPGGGGAVGQTYAAGKKGDPYTILLAGTTLISVPVRTGLDVGLDKFQPIAAIGFDLNSLAVREDSPFRTLKDFLDAARAKPEDDQRRDHLSRRQRAPDDSSSREAGRRAHQHGLVQERNRHRDGGPRRAHPRDRREPGRGHAARRDEEAAAPGRSGGVTSVRTAERSHPQGAGLRHPRRRAAQLRLPRGRIRAT